MSSALLGPGCTATNLTMSKKQVGKNYESRTLKRFVKLRDKKINNKSELCLIVRKISQCDETKP